LGNHFIKLFNPTIPLQGLLFHLFSSDFSFIRFYYTITLACRVNFSFGKLVFTAKPVTDVTEQFQTVSMVQFYKPNL